MHRMIFQELEAMRQRQINMINSEFDDFKKKLALYLCENSTQENSAAASTPDELFLTLPFKSGTTAFKGRKPVSVNFGSREVSAFTWKQVVTAVFQDVTANSEYRLALHELCGKVNGKKRKLLSHDTENMVSPIQIGENLYFESHYDTETLLKILIGRVLEPIHYDFSAITITVR